MNNKQPLGKNTATARFVRHKLVSFGSFLLLTLVFATSMPNAHAMAFIDQEEVAVQATISEIEANQYGPTRRSDTIWVIANRIHPDRSVSIYQTMVAIVDLNPEVVVDDDINVLPVGVLLRLPTANQIRATHAENARKRMIPKLGGSLAEIAFDFTNEELEEKSVELAEAERELAAERVRVGRLQDELTDLQTRYDEVTQQLASTELELTAANENRDRAITELQELRENQRHRPASVTTKISQYWQQQGQTGWLLAILVLVILIALSAILFGKRRKQDPEEHAPYPKAAARYVAERSDSSASEKNEQDEVSKPNSASGDKNGSASDAEITKDDFRDIDDIIDEAEADADADSDIDPGQTPAEAEQAAREELAAQIDLARAYLEMGEFDEATAALAEVMPMTDAELQKEAEQLLEKVNQRKSKE